MDETALLASIPIPWQRMQVLLELLAREFRKGASASTEVVSSLVSKAQTVFKGPIENNIPAGGASLSSTREAEQLSRFLAGVARRPGDTSEAAHRVLVANAFGDWIDAALRPAYGDDWAKVVLPSSDGPADYRPASYFQKGASNWLRKASSPTRVTKKVRKRVDDETTVYCVADVGKWRPDLLPKPR